MSHETYSDYDLTIDPAEDLLAEIATAFAKHLDSREYLNDEYPCWFNLTLPKLADLESSDVIAAVNTQLGYFYMGAVVEDALLDGQTLSLLVRNQSLPEILKHA